MQNKILWLHNIISVHYTITTIFMPHTRDVMNSCDCYTETLC